MIPKTEQNISKNVPTSRSAVSLDSVIKDLQDLRKNWISKKEMEVMEAKMKKLENENTKLKTDLATKEDKRLRYYNLYHENLKEVTEMKAEIELLKAEIDSMKTSITSEDNQETEVSSSSFQSALPVNETRSDNEEDTPAADLVLAICDRSANIPGNATERSSSNEFPEPTSTGKRPLPNDVLGTTAPKKTRIIPDRSCFKCVVCSNSYDTIEKLRDHIASIHSSRFWFCERCPFSSEKRSALVKHERVHEANDIKYRGTDQARFCTLCDICFSPGAAATQHENMYHSIGTIDKNRYY